MKISTIYEDKYLLIVKKPKNICIHKNKINDNNIIDKLKKKLHIVNRLDKDVSGITIFQKKITKIIFLKKKYISLNLGKTYIKNISLPIKKNKKFINNFITKIDKKGKICLTTSKILKLYKMFSILRINIYTGRTHQIRQHLSYLGCPILGDKKYGNFFLNKKISNKKMFLFFKETIFYDSYRKKIFKIKLKTPKKFKKYGST